MKVLDRISEQRRRQLLGGLAALFACLLVAFVMVNAETAQQDVAIISHNTYSTTSDRSSDHRQTPQEDPQKGSQEPFAAKIYSPPGFLDTALAYVKLKVRLNWWSWLSSGLVVAAVAVVVGILWWSMPAGALLVNVDNNVDPEMNQSKHEETIVTKEPEPIFYQRPWFIALMVYGGVGLVLTAVNFVLFLDKSSTSIFLNMVAIPVYIAFIPVYAICALVVGLFGKLGRATGLNVSLHKILLVILYIFSLPFLVVLIILEFMRLLAKMFLSLLTRACLPIDANADWERLSRFFTSCVLMPFHVFEYATKGTAEKFKTACDALISDQPLIAKLSSKF